MRFSNLYVYTITAGVESQEQGMEGESSVLKIETLIEQPRSRRQRLQLEHTSVSGNFENRVFPCESWLLRGYMDLIIHIALGHVNKISCFSSFCLQKFGEGGGGYLLFICRGQRSYATRCETGRVKGKTGTTQVKKE